MSKNLPKIFILIAFILFATGGVFFWNQKITEKTLENPAQVVLNNKLQVVSTNPDPLDGATVLPTQSIEITFNKPLVRSEFKYRLDPETDHVLMVVNGSGSNKDISKTFQITFNKPLELGKGYTLFILPGTHTEDGIRFDKDQNFTFHTINYRGI